MIDLNANLDDELSYPELLQLRSLVFAIARVSRPAQSNPHLARRAKHTEGFRECASAGFKHR